MAQYLAPKLMNPGAVSKVNLVIVVILNPAWQARGIIQLRCREI